MLQQIEEACPIGAHGALIVPPTWIIRVRRHQVTLLSVLNLVCLNVIIKLLVIYIIHCLCFGLTYFTLTLTLD